METENKGPNVRVPLYITEQDQLLKVAWEDFLRLLYPYRLKA
jgi:hypothetical protein